MADAQRQELMRLLAELEAVMRHQGLWEGSPPPPEAFDSDTPFCADTLDFTQWLQWVFVARFRALIGGGHPLPRVCDVTPMAEEALKNADMDERPLLRLLVTFDSYFDSASPRGE
jgi:uncharacterized protein YqcC (DUF446 family)